MRCEHVNTTRSRTKITADRSQEGDVDAASSVPPHRDDAKEDL